MEIPRLTLLGWEVTMKCPNCEHELIWGGDHDDEDADGVEIIISNLSCNECNTFVLVHTPCEANGTDNHTV